MIILCFLEKDLYTEYKIVKLVTNSKLMQIDHL